MGKRKGDQNDNNGFIQDAESEKKKRRVDLSAKPANAQPFRFAPSNEENIHHINPDSVTEEDIQEKKALRKIKGIKGFNEESSILGDTQFESNDTKGGASSSANKNTPNNRSNVKVGGEDFSKSKEGNLFMEDGQVFEPFNLNDERETGRYDENLNFVWNNDKKQKQQQQRDRKKKKIFRNGDEDDDDDEDAEKDAFVDQELEDAEKSLLQKQKQQQQSNQQKENQQSNQQNERSLKDVFLPFEKVFITPSFFSIYAPFFNLKTNEQMEVFFLKTSILNWLDWWNGMKFAELKDISAFFSNFVGIPPTPDLLNQVLDHYPDFSENENSEKTITEIMKQMRIVEKFVTICATKLSSSKSTNQLSTNLSEALAKAERRIKSFSSFFSQLCIELVSHFGEFKLYTTTKEELDKQVSQFRETMKLKPEFFSWSFFWKREPSKTYGPYDTKTIREWVNMGYFKPDNAKIKLVIKDENAKKQNAFLQSLSKLSEFQEIGDMILSIFP